MIIFHSKYSSEQINDTKFYSLPYNLHGIAPLRHTRDSSFLILAKLKKQKECRIF